ncbi:substrate-binding periplasmic protein [Streptomyces sp. AK04-3B]|uniref:substrate-binding periplasmic protein n=1 Tax=Streptomyces sp. AK04-3B TaxID=3028650 RepID=UPI0029BD9CE4|nr:transporter substrate-binding domain-containing protein [Streptomyces sp. AK04-3B]MDX3800417.1 transporter substrate-binding domain-containing protein [Streptomyces sp. AK04-3B]
MTAISLPLALGLTLTACGGSKDSSGTAVKADCKPKHTFSTVKAKQLTVSVYVSPPYSVQKPGGTYGGVDGGIITQIAGMECLSLVEKPVSGAALIESVKSKRADLALGGVYRTPDRAKVLDLTDTLYRDGMAFIGKAKATTIADLKGKSVGVIQGYALRTYVNGEVVQDGSTDEMQWDMHYLVADIARTITLHPGDVRGLQDDQELAELLGVYLDNACNVVATSAQMHVTSYRSTMSSSLITLRPACPLKLA